MPAGGHDHDIDSTSAPSQGILMVVVIEVHMEPPLYGASVILHLAPAIARDEHRGVEGEMVCIRSNGALLRQEHPREEGPQRDAQWEPRELRLREERRPRLLGEDPRGSYPSVGHPLLRSLSPVAAEDSWMLSIGERPPLLDLEVLEVEEGVRLEEIQRFLPCQGPLGSWSRLGIPKCKVVVVAQSEAPLPATAGSTTTVGGAKNADFPRPVILGEDTLASPMHILLGLLVRHC